VLDAPEGIKHAEVLESVYLDDISKMVIGWQTSNEDRQLISKWDKQIGETCKQNQQQVQLFRSSSSHQ